MQGNSVETNELEVYFRDFLREQKNIVGVRHQTLLGYEAAFRLFIKTVPEANVRNIQDRTIWVGFFSTLQEREREVGRGEKRQGVKNSTLPTYRTKLSVFMKWLVVTRKIKINPLLTIQKPLVNYTDRRYLTRTEIGRLFQTCQYDHQWASDFQRCRNVTILRLLILTGVRRGELLGLRLDDINLDKATLTVRSEVSKSKLTRIIPIQRELMVELHQYLRERKAHPIAYTTNALFVSTTKDRALSVHGLKHLVAVLAKESGVHFHLHRARHTFAANLNAVNVSLSHIQQLMGHLDPRMTLKYGRQVTPEVLRASVEKIGNESYID